MTSALFLTLSWSIRSQQMVASRATDCGAFLVSADEKHSSWLTWTASVATTLWVLFVLGLGARELLISPRFSLNELGDWLAGAAAPVALAWFVGAFFLQRKDLRKNSEALELQRREMKIASDVARDQLAAQMAKDRPLLRVEGAAFRENDEGVEHMVLTVLNLGGKNAAVLREDGDQADSDWQVSQMGLHAKIPSASEGWIWMDYPCSGQEDGAGVDISVTYCATDELSREGGGRSSTGDEYHLFVKVRETSDGFATVESGAFSLSLERF